MMLLPPEIAADEAIHTRPQETQPPYSVDEMVQLLLRHDAAVATRYVSALRSGGMSLPTIYLELLAPAARMLGSMWENDECTFTQVTIAVSRMHQVLLKFSPCFCASVAESSDNGLTALIVPIPGEQHTFGLFMVIEFFRRAGWNIWSGNPKTDEELLNVVNQNHFDMLGYSVSAEKKLENLPERIATIRRHSRNRDLRIMLGGRVFTDNPELHREMGADGTATDGMDAVRKAKGILNTTR